MLDSAGEAFVAGRTLESAKLSIGRNLQFSEIAVDELAYPEKGLDQSLILPRVILARRLSHVDTSLSSISFHICL
jgi:hypothetical protein